MEDEIQRLKKDVE